MLHGVISIATLTLRLNRLSLKVGRGRGTWDPGTWGRGTCGLGEAGTSELGDARGFEDVINTWQHLTFALNW